MEVAQNNSNTANLATLPALGSSESSRAPWWPLAALPAGLEAALHHLTSVLFHMVSQGTKKVLNKCLLNEVTPKGYVSFSALRTLDNPPVAAVDLPLPLPSVTSGAAGQA